jgi:EmrB/QacA subfamily drug resistance transporter
MTNLTVSDREKQSVLIIATLTAFITPFLVASINVALPRMTVHFHMEAVVMTWVNTIYFLALAMAQVPMGRLADIYGQKKIFITGLVISAVAAVGGGMANSVTLLLISRAFQGFGAGMTFNTVIAVLTSVFPSESRGKALGISMSGTYAGLILGPLIGGYLTEHYGWPSIFYLSAALIIMELGLVLLTLKGEWREARGEKFDATGSAIYAVAVAMFMYGFSSLPAVTGIVFLTAGITGLVFLVKKELRTPSPILDFRLFKNNRIFLFANLATLSNYLATYALTFLLNLYLQYIKGFSPQKAGLVMIAASIPMTIFTPLAGRLSDKIEPRLVAAAGQFLNAIALLMLIFLGNGTSLWYIIAVLALYGTGIGLFSSPNTNAIMGSVEKKVLGAVSGTIGTMRTGGMMLSMGMMMILFTLFVGQAEITRPLYPQFLTSARVGFIVFTIVCLGGAVAQLAARPKTS